MRCVDCHFLCFKTKRSNEPMRQVGGKGRELIEKHDVTLIRYSLFCAKDKILFNNRLILLTDDPVVERNCPGYEQYNPSLTIDQMLTREIHKPSKWKTVGIALGIISALFGIIYTLFKWLVH